MSFQNGFNMGQRAYQQNIDNRRQAELDDRRKVIEGRQDADYNHLQRLRGAEDAAFQTYSDLQANGVINAQGTGLSGPSANLLYGKAGGYGGGTGAIQEAAGDYQREMGRFAGSLNAPQGGLPMYNGAAPVSQRGASELEIEQALGGVSTARRDTAGMRASMANVKKLTTDAGRRAEYKRLSALDADKLADELGSDFSKDGSGVDAMLTFDPKSKQYVFASKIPGFPSQTLSKSELLNYAMGMWESGNGDYKTGLEQQMATVRAQREMRTQDTARGDGLARGNADLFYKDRTDDRDNQRLGIQRSELALRGREVDSRTKDREAANWQIIGVTGDKKGLLYFNRESRATEARPLPEGSDAAGIFSRLSGAKPPMTEQERLRLDIDMKNAGYTPIERAIALGQDPLAGMRSALGLTGATPTKEKPAAGPTKVPVSVPLPSRGPVGQGAARLPWETPTGSW